MSMMTDGLTEEKRQECREEMRNLIEHMIAEDLHAVHVKHAHNTQKLHGFTRKLLMVFRENCDSRVHMGKETGWPAMPIQAMLMRKTW